MSSDDTKRLTGSINGVSVDDLAYNFLSGDAILREVRTNLSMDNPVVVIVYSFNGAHGSSKELFKEVSWNEFTSYST